MHFEFMDTFISSSHFMPKPKSKREEFVDILVSISGYIVFCSFTILLAYSLTLVIVKLLSNFMLA